MTIREPGQTLISSEGIFREAVEAYQAGDLVRAVSLCERALERSPRLVGALNLLGILTDQRGDPEAAVRYFRSAIEISPGLAHLHSNLGNSLNRLGRHGEAEQALRESLRLLEASPDAWSNLGNALRPQSRREEAVACYRRAVELRPDYPEAHLNLADVLAEGGDLAGAIPHYEETLRLVPGHPDALNNLGAALVTRGLYANAEEVLELAAARAPENPRTQYNLGVAQVQQGKCGRAIRNFRTALELNPAFVEAYDHLGSSRSLQASHQEAVDCYVEALLRRPESAAIHSNLLFVLNYLDNMSAADLFQEHLRWAERHAEPLTAAAPPARRARRDGRIRLGYISPDLRSHSVAFFVEPVLAAHDRSRFEIFCYADVARPDAVTARLTALSHHWRKIDGVSDEELVALLRADDLDILIDLAGHTAGNRLLVLARRPAPLQVTWIGYPNTTGMSAVDLRITDPWADPPGEADTLHSERLVRLPSGFSVYQPPEDSPAPSPPPALRNGYVTFGSFNNTAKLVPGVIEAWSTILHRVPNSRLLLKARQLADPETNEIFLRRFQAHGVPVERLRIFGPTEATPEHLARYSEIDIALDPFPFGGATTSCEALWMGVPVVTLRGDRHASRVGASLLHRVGLPELVADSVEALVEKAAELAADGDRLVGLRLELRDRLRASSVLDSVRVTRELEAALLREWENLGWE